MSETTCTCGESSGCRRHDAPAATVSLEGPHQAVVVELLYLDNRVCGRCQGAEAVLDQAVSELTPVLNATGRRIVLNRVNITSRELAREHRFVSSPTIRVNGHAIQPAGAESRCEACGTLCGDVNCRTWAYRGEHSSTPPKALIVDAILSAVYTTHLDLDPEPGDYAIPEKPRTVLRRARQADRLTETVKLTGPPCGRGRCSAPAGPARDHNRGRRPPQAAARLGSGHHRPAGHAAMLTYARARCGPLRLTVGGDSCPG